MLHKLRPAKDILCFQMNGDGYLSPSSPHGFRLDGIRWPTAKHYLLAQRFPSLAEALRGSKTINEADGLISAAKEPGRPDWNLVERSLLTAALIAKFKSHPRLRAALLATGTRTLLQFPQRPLPGYEGVVTDHDGVVTDNRTGCALMDARATLRRSEARKAARAAEKANKEITQKAAEKADRPAAMTPQKAAMTPQAATSAPSKPSPNQIQRPRNPVAR